MLEVYQVNLGRLLSAPQPCLNSCPNIRPLTICQNQRTKLSQKMEVFWTRYQEGVSIHPKTLVSQGDIGMSTLNNNCSLCFFSDIFLKFLCPGSYFPNFITKLWFSPKTVQKRQDYQNFDTGMISTKRWQIVSKSLTLYHII